MPTNPCADQHLLWPRAETPTACDVDITQLVDTKDGVHVICPKALFTGPRSTPQP